jgi:glyoxylase-like metal-dependent hydrolase (beta-lactamase superfamily II)
MQVEAFFDRRTSTLTYVVHDLETKDAVIIDPVLDYDPVGVRVFHDSADAIVAFVREHGLTVRGVLDTHAHADHLSGMHVLKERLGAPTAIGAHITAVQAYFAGVFDKGPAFRTDGSQFDRLLRDGEVVDFGSLRIEAIHTPGHTPACMTYRIKDAIFTGDAMFMPDFGTGRCDFPKGSAHDLYDSIQRLYELPDHTRVFVGHDYQPGGRELRYETTIGEQKRTNKQLKANTTREEFVRFRKERDATLSLPTLLFQSVQVNIEAGRLPDPTGPVELRYLKLPLNLFD